MQVVPVAAEHALASSTPPSPMVGEDDASTPSDVELPDVPLDVRDESPVLLVVMADTDDDVPALEEPTAPLVIPDVDIDMTLLLDRSGISPVTRGAQDPFKQRSSAGHSSSTEQRAAGSRPPHAVPMIESAAIASQTDQDRHCMCEV